MDGIISDKIWHCIFIQCPKCESGIHLLESDSRPQMEGEIKAVWHRPKFCSCGYLLESDEINSQKMNGYSMPSLSWVCPKCSIFQSVLAHFEGFHQEDNEKWKEDLSTRISVFQMPKELRCKGCNEIWKRITVLNEDNTQVITGLGEIKS